MSDQEDLTFKLTEVLLKQAEALIRMSALVEKLTGVDDPIEVVGTECDHDFYAGVCRNCGATSFLGVQ